jgi:hypothetical protein
LEVYRIDNYLIDIIFTSQNCRHSTNYEAQNKVYRGQLTTGSVKNSPLDLNHTHFVLLDDMLGEVTEETNAEVPRRPDLTIKMRAEIEHQISKSKTLITS